MKFVEKFATNRKASFNYEILEEFEAGIELYGHEVKAIRAGLASLDGGHVSVRGSEAYLIGVTVSAYQPANTPKGYNPTRSRKLLLTKKEIAQLEGIERQRGLTIVPLAMYNKGRNIKVTIASVRGKKKFDKRETLKRREADRDIQRTLKDRL